MIPLPRMSDAPPFGWSPAVLLTATDAREVVRWLVSGDLQNRLTSALQEAEQMAGRLNSIDRGEEA
jgi:hypothetical protein